MTSLTGWPSLPNSTVACPAFGANRTTHASVEQIPIRLLSFDIHSSLDRDRPVAPGLIDVENRRASRKGAAGRRPAKRRGRKSPRARLLLPRRRSERSVRPRTERPQGTLSRPIIRALNFEIGTFDPTFLQDDTTLLLEPPRSRHGPRMRPQPPPLSFLQPLRATATHAHRSLGDGFSFGQ